MQVHLKGFASAPDVAVGEGVAQERGFVEHIQAGDFVDEGLAQVHCGFVECIQAEHLDDENCLFFVRHIQNEGHWVHAQSFAFDRRDFAEIPSVKNFVGRVDRVYVYSLKGVIC